MNRSEALSTLSLTDSATDEDIKKAFKKIAKEKHPDRNKSPEAEVEYKKASEAFEYLKSGKAEEYQGFNINDIFSNFNPFGGFRNSTNFETLYLDVTLSFKESVLGCSKSFNYDKYIKCNTCNGAGNKPTSEVCVNCKGAGAFRKQQKSGNSVFITETMCNACNGAKVKTEPCKPCNSTGGTKSATTITTSVPGGILDGQVLRLGQGGHFKGASPFGDQFDDAYIKVKVTKEDGMELIDNDVVSVIDVELVDALKGMDKKVKTINGESTIKIRAPAKNKDEIKLAGLGVSGKGHHRFILNVKYPEDLSKLIKTLEDV